MASGNWRWAGLRGKRGGIVRMAPQHQEPAWSQRPEAQPQALGLRLLGTACLSVAWAGNSSGLGHPPPPKKKATWDICKCFGVFSHPFQPAQAPWACSWALTAPSAPCPRPARTTHIREQKDAGGLEGASAFPGEPGRPSSGKEPAPARWAPRLTGYGSIWVRAGLSHAPALPPPRTLSHSSCSCFLP